MSPFGEDVQDLLGGGNLEIDGNMWMIVRFIVILRGLFASLELDISAVNIWRKYAAKVLDSLLVGEEDDVGEDPDTLAAKDTSDEDAVAEPRRPRTTAPTISEMRELRSFSKWLRVSAPLRASYASVGGPVCGEVAAASAPVLYSACNLQRGA